MSAGATGRDGQRGDDEGLAAVTGVEHWLSKGRVWSEGVLEVALEGLVDVPAELRQSLRYALLGGGKRVRPTLVRLFCEAAGGVAADAAGPAAAIEMVHTYSLVHDDLPCMDDDDLRRGRPTVHKEWDEAMAVLAGDALLTEAFGVMAECTQAGTLVGILARVAGAAGMVGGQVLDLGVCLEGLTESERLVAVEGVHASKTAALFAGACELGWVAGDGSSELRGAARDYGHELGMLFQATDDRMDVMGSADGLGKTPGKDAALERPTLVAALGLEGAGARAIVRADAVREAAERLGLAEGHPAHDLAGFLLMRTT